MPDAEHPEKKQRTDERVVTKVEGSAGGSVYQGTNAVPRAGNPPRTLHLGLTDGELANRVVVVGHPSRAELIASHLSPEEAGGKVFYFASDRGFVTHTGLFEGARVSVVAIGMGLAMMDFFVREARAVVKGSMAVVRLGTCGVLQDNIKPGTVSASTPGAVLVQRDCEAFAPDGDAPEDSAKAYRISSLCAPDETLAKATVKELGAVLGDAGVVQGVNVTADSFYSSQGRQDPDFQDANTGVIEEVLRRYPNAVSMEMESFQLLHLARCCRPKGHFRAASVLVNVANRRTGEVATGEAIHAAERGAGVALLKALAHLDLEIQSA